MFQVSAVNLSPDARSADPTLGAVPLGEVSPDALLVLLEQFRRLDALQNDEAEPHIFITAPAGKFLIRTGQGKLYLYNARNIAEPYAELTPAEILAQLERSEVITAPLHDTETEAPAPSARAPHRAIAVAILASGLALNAYTVHSVSYVDSVNTAPAVTLITEAAELTMRHHDVIGRFATGDQPGERVILIQADGRVNFVEIGVKNPRAENSDTYRIGKRAGKLCLATTDNGTIDVRDFDTIEYYGDTYRRVR